MSYGDGKALVTGASSGIGAAVAEVWLAMSSPFKDVPSLSCIPYRRLRRAAIERRR